MILSDLLYHPHDQENEGLTSWGLGLVQFSTPNAAAGGMGFLEWLKPPEQSCVSLGSTRTAPATGDLARPHQNGPRGCATNNKGFMVALGPLHKRVQMKPRHTGSQHWHREAETRWWHLLTRTITAVGLKRCLW